MAKNTAKVGIEIAKQPSKGAPRCMEEDKRTPKEATRCPYSNPAMAENRPGMGKNMMGEK